MTELSARQREAILRRAIISVKPEYYSWPIEAQERYRVSVPDEDAYRMNQIVLKALFGIEASTQAAVDAAFSSLTDRASTSCLPAPFRRSKGSAMTIFI